MCRIGALKSKRYMHPSIALKLMRSQQKGHDNSGFAFVMQDLGGVFEHYKENIARHWFYKGNAMGA